MSAGLRPREWRSLAVVLAIALGVVALSQWWGRQRDSAQGAQLAALAKAGDIRMLSSVTCTYCAQARQYLSEHRVPFDECFIERSESCASDYQATLAQGTPTLLVRGQMQLGFAVDRVIARLKGLR